MRKLTEEESVHLIVQISQCYRAITGLLPENKHEATIETLRQVLETVRHFENDPALKHMATTMRDHVEDMAKAYHLPMEILERPSAYNTALNRKIVLSFAAPRDLIAARSKGDGQMIKRFEHDIELVRNELKKLHDTTPGDAKEITASALKEFAAAAYIARCDNPEITREEVHKALGGKKR